jgi:methionyl-tRNA synthetase
MAKNKFYITTPIYYVNDAPHIGHAYTTIVGDVLARYKRQNGFDTYYLTGTDEHGTKVAEAAEKENKTPQQFVDHISDIYKKRWQALNISNDYFIRTTDKDHIKRVQDIFTKLNNSKTPKGNTVIYESDYQGLYCTGCEKFLTEKELHKGKCPDHDKTPESLSEKNYFFRLSDYKDILKEKIAGDEFKILPTKRKNEALSMLDFIDDFSISRESVTWGIELPFDKKQKAYVWVDALSNYITALGYPDTPDNFKKFWPADLHLLAQDILKFHTIYWPAMLIALDLPLPKTEFIHGFFTIDGEKMGKSRGNMIDPQDLVDKYGTDATRYLLLSQFSFGNEADVQVERFDEKYNADLANGLGNLVARITNLIEKDELALSIKKGSEAKLKKEFNSKMDQYKFDEALKMLWARLRHADEVITKTEPWKIKDKTKLTEILEPLAQDVLNVSDLLTPFMPEVSDKIITYLTVKKIIKAEPLFPRI